VLFSGSQQCRSLTATILFILFRSADARGSSREGRRDARENAQRAALRNTALRRFLISTDAHEPNQGL
jgi:hypothetical protein